MCNKINCYSNKFAIYNKSILFKTMYRLIYQSIPLCLRYKSLKFRFRRSAERTYIALLDENSIVPRAIFRGLTCTNSNEIYSLKFRSCVG